MLQYLWAYTYPFLILVILTLTKLTDEIWFTVTGDIEAGTGLRTVGVRGAFSFYWLHELASSIISAGAGCKT